MAMFVDLFRTRDHVPDFDEKVAEYVKRSAGTRSSLGRESSVSYGSHPAQKLDIFYPAGNLGDRSVHMFIHGGYWRMFSKDDFSFVANTITSAGAVAVVIDYALMPEVRLAEVVNQVRQAQAWVMTNIDRYGADPARFTVSGHSAGAHLAASLFKAGEDTPPKGALLLSGVYDLRPLQQSFLQPLIGLTDEEVSEFSPLSYRFQRGVSVRILYGDRETEPFHRQAESLATHLREQECEVGISALRNSDHMSCVLDLGSPSTEAGRHLISTILSG